MFRAAKDALAGKSARVYLNDMLARYGRLEDLRIDSKRGRMEMSCLLHGESEPLRIEIGRYVIEDRGGEKMLRLADCHCSRLWVQNLLNDYAEQKAFPLPAWAAAALS